VADNEFQPVELLRDDYIRMAETAKQYVGFPLGTTDASIVAIAERLGINTIATVDPKTGAFQPASPELIERVAKAMMRIEPQVLTSQSTIWDPGPPVVPDPFNRRLIVLRLPSCDVDERGRPLPLVFAWPREVRVDTRQMAECAEAINRTLDFDEANEILRRRKLQRDQRPESEAPIRQMSSSIRSPRNITDALIPPERRRAVVVLDEPGYRIALNRAGFAEFRDDAEVAIVLDTDRTPLAEAIREQGLMVPGKVLTQNPTDTNLYLEPAEVIEESALARSYAVTQIAIARRGELPLHP